MIPYDIKKPINVTVKKIEIQTGMVDACHNPVTIQDDVNCYIFIKEEKWTDGHKRYSFFSEDPENNPKAKHSDLLFDIQNLINGILYYTPYRHDFVRLVPINGNRCRVGEQKIGDSGISIDTGGLFDVVTT